MTNTFVSRAARVASLALAAFIMFAAAAEMYAEDGQPGVYPIAGADQSLPLGDLAPFGGIVRSARYVGLGEPVHTTGGAYALKGRIVRHLVEEKGFRALGWENPFLRSEAAAAYLQTCEGSAATAVVRGIGRVWQSTEVADLFQWLCDWNQAHPDDRVSVYGFDIQGQAAYFGRSLVAFLDRLGIPRDDPRFADLSLCDGLDETFFPFRIIPDDRYGRCQAALSATAAHFDANAAAIVQQTSSTDLGWARVYLVGSQTVQEFQKTLFTELARAVRAREIGMAYFAQAIHDLRFPRARTALWAHNGHVMRNSEQALGGLPAMGGFLADSLGPDYVIAAVTAVESYVNSPGFIGCGLLNYDRYDPQGIHPSVEPVISALGYGPVLLDLRAGHPHPTFLDEEYGIADFYKAVLPNSFDALFNLEVSPAMHALPGVPSCP